MICTLSFFARVVLLNSICNTVCHTAVLEKIQEVDPS